MSNGIIDQKEAKTACANLRRASSTQPYIKNLQCHFMLWRKTATSVSAYKLHIGDFVSLSPICCWEVGCRLIYVGRPVLIIFPRIHRFKFLSISLISWFYSFKSIYLNCLSFPCISPYSCISNEDTNLSSYKKDLSLVFAQS